jgi:hypothetical protein
VRRLGEKTDAAALSAAHAMPIWTALICTRMCGWRP